MKDVLVIHNSYPLQLYPTQDGSKLVGKLKLLLSIAKEGILLLYKGDSFILLLYLK